MKIHATRRTFLQRVAGGGAIAGLGDLAFLSRLPQVSAAESRLDAGVVQLRAEIEPLVKLLEETPRDKLLEKVAAKIRKGLAYRELIAALLLAGVRNVQPRPHVGYKFHAVLVVNSAHLASISSPEAHRWLPVFWALDYFKSSQASDVREGNWTMAAIDEKVVPRATKARGAFVDAMNNWDVAAADVAVAGFARSAGAHEVFEEFFRLGARDFRSIGHKAIFVANSLRTLQCVGWRHAEPVVRSLAYALQNHEGDNPAKRDAEADRPWRRNCGLARKIREDWAGGKLDDAATKEMIATLRDGSADDACDKVVALLNKGISPQSIWDGIFVGAGELLARQPGIVALHAVTTSNALRYAFDSTASDDTRRMLLLQNAAFLPLFRRAMRDRGGLADVRLDELAAAAPAKDHAVAIEAIFRDVSSSPMAAARGVYGYLRQKGDPKTLIDAARVLVFLKGNNAHDYKFSSAVLEDYYNVSPAWRDRCLASAVFKLRGSGGADNRLVARTRAALKA